MEIMLSFEPISKISISKVRLYITWILVIMLMISTLVILTPGKYPAAPRQENNTPEAVIDSPENANTYEINQVVHFDASSSSDPDNDALTYTWNFGDGNTGAGKTAQHAYAFPWVPVITLRVDDGELNDTARVVIIIGTGGGNNRPPTAVIDEPNNLDEFSVGEIIYFDGSSSEDPDDDQLTYHWDFGDGNESIDMVTSHAYGETRQVPYIVTLTVNDGIFNDSERIALNISNTPTMADAGEDKTGYPGLELIFDGSNSSDIDRFDSIINYTWDMGDREERYGEVVVYDYDRYGTFYVTLTVRDNDGDSGSDELKVIITNAQPVAVLNINSENTYIDTDIEFDATSSYDLDGEVVEYNYNFGDGSVTDWITDPKVSHRYYSYATYDVTLRVRDDFNEISDPITMEIEIIEKTNKPPSITISYPSNFDSVAGILTIFGTASDQDGNIDEVTLKIDDGTWDDVTIISTSVDTLDWEYTWNSESLNDGEHIITARVTDEANEDSEDSIKVTVNNRPTTFIDLTFEIKPTNVMPNDEVTASGSAVYDTEVPVINTEVVIEIIETKKKWTTSTDSQGQFVKKISAPTNSGTFTVSAYVTDGTLEREKSEKLSVMSPPDLYIEPGDISFSTNKPVERKRISILATIHNSGQIDATGKVSFYLDTIDTNTPFDSKTVSVPGSGSILVTVTWIPRAGAHNIIVEISDVSPEESDNTNNQAIQKITVAKATIDEPEEKDEESGVVATLTNLPLLYWILIIGAIIAFFIIVGVAKSRGLSSGEKDKGDKTKKSGTGQVGKQQPGVVVFKPLDNNNYNNRTISNKDRDIDALHKDLKTGRDKKQVKFKILESEKDVNINVGQMGKKHGIKFESVGFR